MLLRQNPASSPAAHQCQGQHCRALDSPEGSRGRWDPPKPRTRHPSSGAPPPTRVGSETRGTCEEECSLLLPSRELELPRAGTVGLRSWPHPFLHHSPPVSQPDGHGTLTEASLPAHGRRAHPELLAWAGAWNKGPRLLYRESPSQRDRQAWPCDHNTQQLRTHREAATLPSQEPFFRPNGSRGPLLTPTQHQRGETSLESGRLGFHTFPSVSPLAGLPGPSYSPAVNGRPGLHQRVPAETHLEGLKTDSRKGFTPHQGTSWLGWVWKSLCDNLPGDCRAQLG